MPSAASSLASIAGQSAHSHDLYPSGRKPLGSKGDNRSQAKYVGAADQFLLLPDPYASAGTSMVDPWQNYMAAAASGHAAYYSAGAAAAAAGRLNQVPQCIHLPI